MSPLAVIENRESFPDRVESTFRMVEKMPTVGQDTIEMSPRWSPCNWLQTRVSDGKVYIFLPGIVVVYDYHEFKATTREPQ